MASEGTPITEETVSISSIGYYTVRLAIYWGWLGRKLAPEEIAEIVSARDATAELARAERVRGSETYDDADRDAFEQLAAGFALAAIVATPTEYGEELTRNVNLIYTAVKHNAKKAHDGALDMRAAHVEDAVEDALGGDDTRMRWMRGFITENIIKYPGRESEVKWSAAITTLLLSDIKAGQRWCEREASAAPGDPRGPPNIHGAQRELGRTIVDSFLRISHTIENSLGIRTLPNGTVHYALA